MTSLIYVTGKFDTSIFLLRFKPNLQFNIWWSDDKKYLFLPFFHILQSSYPWQILGPSLINFCIFLGSSRTPLVPFLVELKSANELWPSIIHVYLKSFLGTDSLCISTFWNKSKFQLLVFARSCKRREILFQKSWPIFLTWREYFYSQPKKSGY